jgi:hypothetical protein
MPAAFPDHAIARATFDRAVELAEGLSALPAEWIELVSQIGSMKTRTFTAAIGTVLLARATDAHVDPLTLQADAPASQGQRAYSARTLASSVLVPKSREHRVDLRVRGDEPLQNNPFTDERRLDRRLPVKHPQELDLLVSACERAQVLTKADALLALAAFIRVRRDAAAAAEIPVAMLATDFPASRLVAATSLFVNEDPESGKRGQALVAAVLDGVYSDVSTSNVHSSSRKIPGDVIARRDGSVFVSAEVKQKVVQGHQVLGFVDSLRAAGIARGIYAAIAVGQPSLTWDAFVMEAARRGVALAYFTSPGALLAAGAAWDPSGTAFESLPERMMTRLRDVGASRQSQEEWARVVSAPPEATPAQVPPKPG